MQYRELGVGEETEGEKGEQTRNRTRVQARIVIVWRRGRGIKRACPSLCRSPVNHSSLDLVASPNGRLTTAATATTTTADNYARLRC